ncbi:arginine--tRNA ligase [Bryobacter aggregatus]|uniref:arginine--tRNA ligase domain-containing protein n=1 Tax=Bryobacter aggregatus TaxID=360054 RepID=UPI0004E1ABDB|nr:arginine--tRNA ligase [Bryobacter aggregatus]
MFYSLERSISRAVSQYLLRQFEVEIPVVAEQPKQTSFGEVALPVAFQLARQLKKAPKAIAEQLATDLSGQIEGVAALEVANGYLNVRFDRGWYARQILTGHDQDTQEFSTAKTIVEHTNINPNKAAHIGHLRNAILGDTFVRMMKAMGTRVEVQNYIDNTGVQVADVVAAFHFLEKKSAAEVLELTRQPRFDYLCWDLYAKISQLEDGKQWRAETLHEIEAGVGPLSDMGHVVADAIVECHLNTMLRLGIEYDVLPRESEILHLKFWSNCFEQLKEKKAIYLETEGKNKGCWVMPGSAFRENAGEEDSKVIVRSNGIVTYVGKDIAYQLWKFGLLGKDFYYRESRTYPSGHRCYVSQSTPEGAEPVQFGAGSSVYNVIDSRQSYLQDVVAAGLRALGYNEQADRSIHFSYEMVALSPRTCTELGIELSEEDAARAYVEVSGRKGLGVKADDLIDTLTERARAEVDSRHAEKPEASRAIVAHQIAVCALRYFMLKFTRTTVIAFDLQEALSFTGETGPYVQYAAVRASKILGKIAERGETMPDFRAVLSREVFARVLENEDLWQLLLDISRLDVVLRSAVQSGEPASLAKYAYQLAQAFSRFYADFRVLDETDEARRTVLLWMTKYFAAQLEKTLATLGIPVPEYM